MNSAYGLALDNLYYLVDWNDYGIDEPPAQRTLCGLPSEWFGCHGWRAFSAEFGSEWGPVTQADPHHDYGPNPDRVPRWPG